MAMKILVLGLDCAAPELLLGYDDLPNIRRLMEASRLRGSQVSGHCDTVRAGSVPGSGLYST